MQGHLAAGYRRFDQAKISSLEVRTTPRGKARFDSKFKSKTLSSACPFFVESVYKHFLVVLMSIFRERLHNHLHKARKRLLLTLCSIEVQSRTARLARFPWRSDSFIPPHDFFFHIEMHGFFSGFFVGCREMSCRLKRTRAFFLASGWRGVDPRSWARSCRGTLDERSKRRLKRLVDLR